MSNDLAVAQKTGIPKWVKPWQVEPWTETCSLPLRSWKVLSVHRVKQFDPRLPFAAGTGGVLGHPCEQGGATHGNGARNRLKADGQIY